MANYFRHGHELISLYRLVTTPFIAHFGSLIKGGNKRLLNHHTVSKICAKYPGIANAMQVKQGLVIKCNLYMLRSKDQTIAE